MPARLLAHHRDRANALGMELAGDVRHQQAAFDRLPPGHRHRIVVEQLVGDVDAGRDRRADGQQSGMIVGAVAEVLEHVRARREGRLADPVQPLAAHLRERPRGPVLQPHRHAVAADAGRGDAALRHPGRAVVRAAGAGRSGRRTSSPAVPAAQGWTMSAGGLSRAASVSASAQPPARRRSTRMPATMSAPSSPAEGTSGRPRSSPLPVRRGRRCASTPNSSRASWSSITGRFSSTTRTSSWPAQKSRMREGSSGHGMATL